MVIKIKYEVEHSQRSMKLKNIQKYYIGKLDQVEEEPRKLALPNLKALDFDKT